MKNTGRDISNDRQRFSNSLKSFAERSEDWITRTSYQPYKWLFVLPLLITTTLICGIFAIIISLLFSTRAGGILWRNLGKNQQLFHPDDR
ncbi:MAG: hypothetical protein MZV70_66485 [Desulfobacterales bacterium]|nr:hypothetical protein [Desulfobacterales bacterium]